MASPDAAALGDLARELSSAAAAGRAIEQLSRQRILSLTSAYGIQLVGARMRAEAGDPPVGLKLGFTSREKAAQMGVRDVILGVLSASAQVSDGAALPLRTLIHPRVEPEAAFLLREDAATADLSDETTDLLDYVTHIAPALEVIDSRYRDFSFSLEDVVADNTSAARFAVGRWLELGAVRASRDLARLAVRLEVDGTAVATGSTGNILGDPLRALAAVRRLANRYGHALTPGGIILAGAATAAVPLRAGTNVVATIEGIGSVSVRTG